MTIFLKVTVSSELKTLCQDVLTKPWVKERLGKFGQKVVEETVKVEENLNQPGLCSEVTFW